MKLIIQIPCLNEEATLPATIADLPRQIDGIDEIELLVIDDGSTDRTVEVAREHGRRAHRPPDQQQGPRRRLPGRASTPASSSAPTSSSTPTPTTSTAAPTSPSWSRRSSPARPTWSSATARSAEIEHFSGSKKALQRLGSWVVRRLSGTEIADTTSGFRAYNREAALGLLVVDDFTYTLESLIQAGKMLVAVDQVAVETNPQTRESRLFDSTGAYVRRNALSILRIYTRYEPLRVFASAGAARRAARAGRLDAVPARLDPQRRLAAATSSR